MSTALPRPRRRAPPRPPRAGGARTAERILDAAEAVFAERGFAGTALRDVAERVGVRAPSLYNHFASKESLYAAVLERALGPLLELLRDAAAGRGAGDPDGLVTDPSGQLVTDLMALLARHPHLPRLVAHETLAGSERLTPMLERWLAPAFARGLELALGGRFEGAQLPHLVLAMYHVVVGYFTSVHLYAQLAAEDALSEAALARQTHFLRELVALLFPADPAATHRGA
jgi:AcrR family transcriptional regulator